MICSSLLFSASFRIFYSKAKRFHKKEFQANILNIPTTCIVVQRLERVITHIPTKTVVTCQNGRSQIQNKEKALQILKNKLIVLKEKENIEKMDNLRGEQKNIDFGSQIRSYVMHPYSLVKDHRTNMETSNVLKVLDGDIDIFINSNIRRK